MLRTGASRLAVRSIAAPATRPISATFQRGAAQLQRTTNFSSAGAKRPQTPSMAQLKPIQAAVLRRTLADKIDHKAEKRYAEERIKPTPETVSPESSTQSMAAMPVDRADDNVDMMAGVKHDLVGHNGRNSTSISFADMVGVEYHQRDIQPQRSTATGLFYRPGRRSPLPRDLLVHRILLLGNQSRGRWLWIHDLCTQCRSYAAHPRTLAGRVRGSRKYTHGPCLG
jgi:hypothetical protein